MDNQRLLVWAAFGVLLWLAYQTWMQDYGPAPVPATQPAIALVGQKQNNKHMHVN